MQSPASNGALFALVALLMLFSLTAVTHVNALPNTFQKGDVFLDTGTNSGATTILWLRPVGNTCVSPTCLQGTLTRPSTSGEGDGMAFDSSGNLYATMGFA